MRHNKNIFKDKSFIAMASISALALAGIAGSMLLNDKKEEDNQKYVADLNGTDESFTYTNRYSEYEDSTTDSKNKKDKELEAGNKASAITTENTSSSDTAESEESTTPYIAEQTTTKTVDEAGVGISKISFSSDSKLVWPIDSSNVIMDFSPDKTVYFSTLDEYKTNDSICLQSSVDTPVYAAAPGTVKDIGYNEEIGNNITLDLGNNYALQYGQMKDLQVQEGTVVKEGDLLGYVANPTKYYSLEGTNLYLKLTLDGNAIDPLDYLNYAE